MTLQLAAAIPAHGHGGGGGHMGGHGGGGHMGGYGGGGHEGGFGGGREMAGGFSGGRDMGARDFGPRDFGPRDFGGRDFAGGRDVEGIRRLDGGGALDGGGRLDGARAGEGLRDFGPGHFAGDGQVSRADFQRIADRGLAGVGRGAVRPYSTTSLAGRGDAIRNNFYTNGWYGGRGWYANHFNRWWPGGWWGGFGWGMGAGMLAGLAWGDLAGWGGYGSAPVSYNYGTTVCYQDDGVYVQGSRVGSAEEYAAQATTLAVAGGADAKIPADDQWRPLGVFALARAEETNPSTFMSLAIDKDGLLRGSYYDAVSDSTTNITGKVDKKTQRAAWTIGDKKAPVYEAGLSNLTQRQTTILVHRDGGKVEQMLLVRVQDGPEADGGAKPAAPPPPAALVPEDGPDEDER